MDRDRFRRLVRQAMLGLPPEFSSLLDNVEVIVRREPSEADREAGEVGPDSDLFGLYTGIPRTERASYGMTLPDRILIFQGPHERAFAPSEMAAEVRRTVRHEVAHHFGIDDARLDALERGRDEAGEARR
ncbi:MAG: metallopeptidase family protein [Dehalococcoidia bacterium]|nr:MAG: metallopeptidase family protein [Dehalococcoidia bacterium]